MQSGISEGPAFRCSHCNEFVSYEELLKHVNRIRDEKESFCPGCGTPQVLTESLAGKCPYCGTELVPVKESLNSR